MLASAVISRGLCLFLSERCWEQVLGGPWVNLSMLLIHWAINTAGTLIIGPRFWAIWVWAEYRLGGKWWLAVNGSSHGGQVQTSLTVEREALHDGTGPEVTSCTGNDNLTRWHICNYHSWLSLSVAWACVSYTPSQFFCNPAGIFIWHSFYKGLSLPLGQEGKTTLQILLQMNLLTPRTRNKTIMKKLGRGGV